MKIKNQVCTLEQSMELNELLKTEEDVFHATFYHFKGEITREAWGKDYYPAFTCSELGVMLIVSDDTHFTQSSYNEHLGEWQTFVLKRPVDEEQVQFDNIYMGEGDTEAEAKADALIWMIKKGITDKENIEESLQD